MNSKLRRVAIESVLRGPVLQVGALLIARVTLSDDDLQRHLAKALFSVFGTVRVEALVGPSRCAFQQLNRRIRTTRKDPPFQKHEAI